MSDFYEIDFISVDSSRSGDAISIRYRSGESTQIYVVDGGFLETGEKLVEHIRKYYDNPSKIDFVVVSHQDGDHAGGIRKVLETFKVDELWMHLPWLYSDELLERFARFKSAENLAKRLKEIYPNIAILEEIAKENGVHIFQPFQGEKVGEFTIMAPTKARYLDLIVESDKTPEASRQAVFDSMSVSQYAESFVDRVSRFIRSFWGEEVFSIQETSSENNMSVVQYAELCGQKILLTADAGRAALLEAAEYAPNVGLNLPGIDGFQVPHHGSRRNVSTEVLDLWLGEKLPSKPEEGEESFSAIISASEKDKDHPRNAVVRAMIHRGAKVVTTEKSGICFFHNSPQRDGWVSAPALPYPATQEE